MAYAVVISLNHTINERLKYFISAPQITTKLKHLKEILERLDHARNRRVDMSAINALEAEIREAVNKLEDVDESYLLHDDMASNQAVDSFLKTVNKLGEEYIRELDKPILTEDEGETVSPIPPPSPPTVGQSGKVDEIVTKLVDLQSEPIIVSLIGMAGIGKTHLAREIYQHPSIAQHFYFTAWVSVGQKHRMKKLFVDILVQIESKPRDEYLEQEIYTLVVLLQNRLHGLRYLIFLDDVWSHHIHEDLIRWLPYNRGRRRIFLTTRLEEVARSRKSSGICANEVAYESRAYDVRFLNNEESWTLLRQNVFGDEYFPSRLEKAGRKIAENCEGLPLLILTVADILRGLDKTEELWNNVALNKTCTFPDAYDRIWDVLFSSYEFLPQYLKPCFLYMGVFPQRFKILRSKLIDLWSVKGFLESPKSESLESFGMECLRKIVSNSLAIRCKQSSKLDGTKSFKIHSAYWHLCVKEARKIKFFHVLNKLTDACQHDLQSHRRLSVQNNILFGMKEVYSSMAATTNTRSLLCTGKHHQYPVPLCFDMIRFYEFPVEVLKLLQLKYFAITHNGKLPSSISDLQQLHYLTVRQHYNIKLVRDLYSGSTCLPKEIWDMQELRHLRIMGSNLPDPTIGRTRKMKLSTLDVNAHSCTWDVFRRTPQLTKLGINIEIQPDASEIFSCFEHINLLDGLESLRCVVVNPVRSRVFAQPVHLSNLPMNLKKLSLNGLEYSWEYMTAIGSLPKLQVLKLRCYAFQGPKWTTKAGEFQSLKFLLLEDIDLEQWTAQDDYKRIIDEYYKWRTDNTIKLLPSFQHLIIHNCYKLKAIPSQIGALPALEMIEVVDCSPSLVASAIQKIRNSSVQVVITSSWSL